MALTAKIVTLRKRDSAQGDVYKLWSLAALHCAKYTLTGQLAKGESIVVNMYHTSFAQYVLEALPLCTFQLTINYA